MARDLEFRGVIPATLLAFNDDFSIDEAESRKHLNDVASTRGLTAITVNGHASEVHACSLQEQRRILAFSVDEIGDRLPVVCGVYADGSHEAARIARWATEEGASALLVFPPQCMTLGMRPEMALAHFEMIAEATDLPLVVFQYPIASNLGYPFDTLLQMFERIPSIKAIKDNSSIPMLHERHIRTFQSLPRPVSVLTAHSSWLMSSLVMGANGLLSGAGSIIPDLQVSLFEAVQAKDLERAQDVNDRMYPLVQAFYAAPAVDMHNRMKECLRMLGRVEKAVVRPPLVKLSEAELTYLQCTLREAGTEDLSTDSRSELLSSATTG